MNIPFEGWTEPPMPGELRLIPIGGLGEFGMNAMVVHTGRNLVLVDCGQLFPSEDQPGIDSIVPDFAYLEAFAEDVDAVVLTHGHEDHIGALPYFLRRWKVPVYGTAFTLALVAGKLKEHGLDLDLLQVVEDFQKVAIANADGASELAVEWIPVTHSIPDACALALHTPQGVVIHSGDWKLDPTPIDGRLTGMHRLQELGDQGVRVLLADSTNILQPGTTPSEAKCREGLDDAFRLTKGALFLATFSTNIHRIQTLLDLAYEHGRKVILVGRSIDRNVGLARDLRKLKLPDDLFIDLKDAHLFPKSQLLVLCTGSQGEPQSGLMRILRGEAKGLHMGPGDRLVLSSRAIPGNELGIARLLDQAARLGAETFLEGIGTIHVTGHGHREDAATLIRTCRPEVMVPVHGTFRNLMAHGRVAEGLGWKPENIEFLDGGRCLQLFDGDRHRLAGEVPVGKCFVDQGVEHMVDARVIQDRLIMQEDGVIFVTLVLDPATGTLASEPSITSRGFVVLSDDEAYGNLLREAVKRAFDEAPEAVRRDWEALRDLVRATVRKVVRKTTATRPMVIPVVLQLDAV